MPVSVSCPNGHSWEDGARCPECGWFEALPADAVTLAPTAQAELPQHVSEVTLDAAVRPTPAIAHVLPAIEGYEILSELGRGGMGVVYKARQVGLNRLVALKMILAGVHAGADDLRRFKTEAEAVASLQHRNIVQIHEIGEHHGLPYFSLEYCNGGNLADRLDGTPWPPRDAARFIESLARAMYAAHERGIIHRDLKPANVLLTFSREPPASAGLTDDCVPRITDFGLAKKLDSAIQRTQSGAIMGTPSYMAPEQAGGKSKEISPGVDIHALGAILYELLTGRPPYRAATQLDTLLLVVGQEPVPPRQLNSLVPLDLETICLKCLQKEPARRYATVLALAEDLQRFQAQEPIQARPVGRMERGWRWCRRNPATAALVTAVAAALIVGASVAAFFAVRAANKADEAQHNAADAIAARGLAEDNANLMRQEAGRADRKAKEAADNATTAGKRQKEATHELERADALLYRTQLQQAQREWEAGNVPRALAALESCRWEMRSWEHDRLFTLFQGSQFTLECAGSVTCVRLSRNGAWVAAGVDVGHGEIHVWDVKTGKHLHQLRMEPGTKEGPEEMFSRNHSIHSIDFSPDGKLLAAGYNEFHFAIEKKSGGFTEGRVEKAGGTVRIWDLETGKLRSTFPSPDYSDLSVAFSPDGKQVAAGPRYRRQPSGSGPVVESSEPSKNSDPEESSEKSAYKVSLWDSATGKEVRSLSSPQGIVRLAFAPNGKRLAGVTEAGGNVSSVRVWDLENGQKLYSVHPPSGHVNQLLFSSNSATLIFAGTGGIRTWNAADGTESSTRGGSGWDLRLPTSAREAVKVWSLRSLKELFVLRGHTQPVEDMDLWQSIAVTCSTDKTVRIWRLDEYGSSLSDTFKGFASLLSTRRLPGSDRLAALGYSWSRGSQSSIQISDHGNQTQLLSSGEAVQRIAIDPDGKIIATATKVGLTNDAEVKLWSAETGKLLRVLTSEPMPVGRMRFLAAGKRLLAERPNVDGPFRPMGLFVWDVDSGDVVLQLERQTGGVEATAVQPGGVRLAATAPATPEQPSPPLTLWDVLTGKPVITFENASKNLGYVSFSPDGRWLFAHDVINGQSRIWDTVTGQVKHSFENNKELAGRPCFSPDSNRLAWVVLAEGKPGEKDHEPAEKKHLDVKVWDIDSGTQALSCATPPLATKFFNRNAWVRFSQDGQRLLSYHSADALRVWHATTGALLHTIPAAQHEWAPLLVSPDGNWLIRSDKNGLTAVDVATEKQSHSFRPGNPQGSADALVRSANLPSVFFDPEYFSPDGKYLTDDYGVFDIATGLERLPLCDGQRRAQNLAFSDGGRFVVAVLVNESMDWKTLLNQGASPEQRNTFAKDNPAPRWIISDVKSGKVVSTLSRPIDLITSMDFSPDGKQVITGAVETKDRGCVKIWDAVSGKLACRLDGLMPPVNSVCWSLDGNLVAAAGESLLGAAASEGILRIWDAASHKQVSEISLPKAAIKDLRISSDGTRILGVGRDHVVRIWDAAHGKLLAELLGHRDRICSAEFSADGKMIVTGCADLVVRLWNAETGQLLSSLKPYVREDRANSVRDHLWAVFTPDGKRILSSGDDGVVTVWDVRTGQELVNFDPIHPSDAKTFPTGFPYGDGDAGRDVSTASMALDAAGRSLLMERHLWGNTVLQQWDSSKSSDHFAIAARHRGVRATVFSPDSKHFASAGGDKTVRIWDVRTGQETFLLEGFRGDVVHIGYSPDGKRLAALTLLAGEDGLPATSEIKVWDTETGRETLSLSIDDGFLVRIEFSPDGERLVGGSQSMRQRREQKDGGKVPRLELTNSKVRVWEVRTGRELQVLTGHKGVVIAASFSPDGSRIVSSDFNPNQAFFAPESGELKVWDAQAGTELKSLRSKGGFYMPARFSTDGRQFVCGEVVFDIPKLGLGQSSLRVFETSTGNVIRSFAGRKGSITSASFSPDGKQILATERWGRWSGGESIVSVLNAADGSLVRPLDSGTGQRTAGSADFSPDGKWVIIQREDLHRDVVDARSGREVVHFRTSSRQEIAAIFNGGEDVGFFSPDGRCLVCPGEGDTINVWPLDVLAKRQQQTK